MLPTKIYIYLILLMRASNMKFGLQKSERRYFRFVTPAVVTSTADIT